jgi:hypothetical protein
VGPLLPRKTDENDNPEDDDPIPKTFLGSPPFERIDHPTGSGHQGQAQAMLAPIVGSVARERSRRAGRSRETLD